MTTVRYAVFLLAALSLGCLSQTPTTNPASTPLVGFFILCFGIVAWTCREPKTRRH